MVYFPLKAIYLGGKLWILIFAIAIAITLKQFFHVLWKCLVTQDVWGGSLVQFHKCSFMGDNFVQLVEYCIEPFSSEDLDLMAVISRRICLRRSIYF
jgi:uncharacterized membrane protein